MLKNANAAKTHSHQNFCEKCGLTRNEQCPFMADPNRKTREKQGPNGIIRIRSFCDADEISRLSLHETFSGYVRYNPIISRTESLVNASKKPDANVTLAVTEDDRIVGIGILKYPPKSERWVRVGERIMMEAAVIEICRPFRSAGISRDILELTLGHPLKEEKILFMVGYSWTWDLDATKLGVMEYRNLLIHLFSSHGFTTYQTNEPNIMMRPENLFMARIGKNISGEAVRKFKLVLFNMDR